MTLESAKDRPVRETRETSRPELPSVSDTRDQVATAAAARVESTRQLEDKGDLPKLSLSQAAISTESTLVTKALSGWTPDVDTLGRVLGPMSSQDRKNLESDYKSHNGHELREDLKARLKPTDYAALVAVLDRKDGQTNLLGAVGVALETTKVDPVEGQKLLRATLETLDSRKLAGLDAESMRTNGKGFLQTIVDNPAVTQENKDLIRTMVLGAQPRLAGNSRRRH